MNGREPQSHQEHHHHGHSEGPRRGPGGRDHGGGRDQRGPENTEFLDLEPTRMLLSLASGLSRSVAEDILRGAIRKRLEERLGPELERIGRVAADLLADDFEANLRIERAIEDHKSTRQNLEQRLVAALAAEGSAGASADVKATPAKPSRPKAKRSSR